MCGAHWKFNERQVRITDLLHNDLLFAIFVALIITQYIYMCIYLFIACLYHVDFKFFKITHSFTAVAPAPTMVPSE